jgi:hypothetical protein
VSEMGMSERLVCRVHNGLCHVPFFTIDSAREVVDAILDELANPTPGMVEAGVGHFATMIGDSDATDAQMIAAIFRAMLSAAVNRAKEG